MSDMQNTIPFLSSPLIQWINFLIGIAGLAGVLIGFISWRESQRKDRLYAYLLRAAERGLDKDLTEETLRTKHAEVSRASEAIADLRKRIETEIPREAKRTVLRDRIDANIKVLQDTLASTLELKRQLTDLDAPQDLPPELLKAVEAEILPEYVQRTQHETLKTYLIIVVSGLAIVSVIVPSDLGFILQTPLVIIGLSILVRLIKGYSLSGLYHADPSTLKAISLGFLVGAFTPLAVATALYPQVMSAIRSGYHSQLPIALGGTTFAFGIIAFCVWLIRNRPGVWWRLLGGLSGMVGLALFALSLLLLFDATSDLDMPVHVVIGFYGLTMASVILICLAVAFQIRFVNHPTSRQ
jgi:hypothetical protein